MSEEQVKAKWDIMCDRVADQMKIFTRPYVTILAGGSHATYIGTGTFLDDHGIHLLTCEHVARHNPTAVYLDVAGDTNLEPGTWRMEPKIDKDVAIAPVSSEEWSNVSGRAQPLPMTKFAPHHATVERELLFFRGIADQNAFVTGFGTEARLTGYCSQEKIDSGDASLFEILWNPSGTTITSGSIAGGGFPFKHDDPAGFSGSLVWNTKFVESGCDFSKWNPSQAVVTGLLRRFDPDTNTLLVWRVEHLHRWL